MASLRDLLFGGGVLKQAAKTGDPAQPAPVPSTTPGGIDMQAEAAKAAARAKAAAPAAPAAPVIPPPKKKTNAQKLGQQYMEVQ